MKTFICKFGALLALSTLVSVCNAGIALATAVETSTLEAMTIDALKASDSRFQVGPYTYISLSSGKEAFDSLVKFYNEENARNDSYQPEQGTPEEFAKERQKLWGGRADEKNGLRAFVVVETASGKSLGYVNLGVANIPFEVFDNALEGGIKFPEAENLVIANIMNVVYGLWPAKMFSEFKNQDPGDKTKNQSLAPVFFYTISPGAHLEKAFEESDLNKLDLNSSDPQHQAIKRNLLSSSRFSLGTDANGGEVIQEGSRKIAKTVFFKFYSDDFLPAKK